MRQDTYVTQEVTEEVHEHMYMYTSTCWDAKWLVDRHYERTPNHAALPNKVCTDCLIYIHGTPYRVHNQGYTIWICAWHHIIHCVDAHAHAHVDERTRRVPSYQTCIANRLHMHQDASFALSRRPCMRRSTCLPLPDRWSGNLRIGIKIHESVG